ncbi:hypothetical protein BH10PSE7_BH10PSE7_15270 [soil metagenome]
MIGGIPWYADKPWIAEALAAAPVRVPRARRNALPDENETAPAKPRATLPAEAIISLTADAFKIALAEFYGCGRTRRLMAARATAIALVAWHGPPGARDSLTQLFDGFAARHIDEDFATETVNAKTRVARAGKGLLL